MVNTGSAITILTKKSADVQGLTVKEKVSEYILGANNIAVQIIGTISLSILLALTLEVEIANVAVCLVDFYLVLIGCDVVYRHNKALGLATIILPKLY